MGFQLHKVQCGDTPDDWKSFSRVGTGVREIRVRDEEGAFRVLYLAKFPGGIYVLHCFQKKSQSTASSDVQLARARYLAVLKMERDEK